METPTITETLEEAQARFDRTPAENLARDFPDGRPVAAPAFKPAKGAKAPRKRRGPPANGEEEVRFNAILSTSKLLDADGRRLRRGQAVSVPERRFSHLELAGKIRNASAAEIESAVRRHGPIGRIG